MLFSRILGEVLILKDWQSVSHFNYGSVDKSNNEIYK